jgi:hypothetical protein
MSDAQRPLDLDQARAALARARDSVAPAAVRSPRPADLSRLQEMEARSNAIDARASAFRETVRQSLGLGAYRGPATAPSRLAAHAMSAPLCDADVCAPRPAAAAASPAPVRAAATAAVITDGAAVIAPPVLSDAPVMADAGMEAEGPGAAAGSDDAQMADAPLPGDIAGDARPAPRRKKFLGIF